MNKNEKLKNADENIRDNWVNGKLSLLAPDKTPPPGAIRIRLNTKISEKENNMWQKVFTPKYRTAWVTLIVLSVLTASLSVPQVRVIANSFLGLFRVEQIEAVDVGISLENMPKEMETRFMAVDNIIGDQLIVDKITAPVEVSDIAEASRLAGFQARMPDVPKGETHVFFRDESTIRMVIERDKWLGLLESMGYNDFVIPESADGAEITFNIPAVVIVGIGDCEYNQVSEIKLSHPDTKTVPPYFRAVPQPSRHLQG
jgi:hypothetical protein